MSETVQGATASQVIDDAEQLVTDAGGKVSSSADTVLDDSAKVIDLASSAIGERFNIDLTEVFGGIALLIVGIDKLVAVFKARSASTPASK